MQDIDSWIRYQLKKGVPVALIKQKLRARGHSANSLSLVDTINSTSLKTNKNKLVLWILGIFVVAIVSIYFNQYTGGVKENTQESCHDCYFIEKQFYSFTSADNSILQVFVGPYEGYVSESWIEGFPGIVKLSSNGESTRYSISKDVIIHSAEDQKLLLDDINILKIGEPIMIFVQTSLSGPHINRIFVLKDFNVLSDDRSNPVLKYTLGNINAVIYIGDIKEVSSSSITILHRAEDKIFDIDDDTKMFDAIWQEIEKPNIGSKAIIFAEHNEKALKVIKLITSYNEEI